MNKRLKSFKICIFIIIGFIYNIGNVGADTITINPNAYVGLGAVTDGNADFCASYAVTRLVHGVKVTLYSQEKQPMKSFSFRIVDGNTNTTFNNSVGHYMVPNDDLCAKYNAEKNECNYDIIDLSWTDFNAAIGNGDNPPRNVSFSTFVTSLEQNNQADVIIKPFANEYFSSVAEDKRIGSFKAAYKDYYFRIEPIYGVTSCYGVPGKKRIYGMFTPETIIGKIINDFKSQEYISTTDAFNITYNFYVNKENGLVNPITGNINTFNNTDEWYYKIIEYLQGGQGYGMGIMKVSAIRNKDNCVYNNYEHFKNNILNGPNDSNGGADGQTNCCEDSLMKTQGGIRFYIEHPECIEPAEYVFNGAKCSYESTATSTLKIKEQDDDDDNNNDIWAKIFANIYNDEKNYPSNFFTRQISSDVTLVCTEGITVTYPAFIDTKISRGGFIIWPKASQLRLNSFVQCRPYVSIYSDGNLDYNAITNGIETAIKDYKLDADFELEYTDKEYGQGKVFDMELIKSIRNNYNIEYDALYGENDLRDYVYQFSAQATYKLPTVYTFQDIESLDYAFNATTAPDDMINHYFDRDQGVLPISYSHKNGDKGSISIKFKKIGGNKNINMGTIKDNDNKIVNTSEYKCEYTIDEPPNKCTCPSGTVNSGTDITKMLCELNKATYKTGFTASGYDCPALQKKYCNDENLVCKADDGTYIGLVTSKSQCDSLKKNYPTNDNNVVNVTCENNNILITKACSDDSECKEHFCNIDNSETCKFECPEDSSNAGKDITRNVFAYLRVKREELLNIGIDDYDSMVQAAYNNITSETTQYSKICWEKSDTKIVYRTISLENAFPSKDGDGRNPGFNWYEYSEYITNDNKIKSRNKSVEGNKLYTDKDPMYVINLTPDIIKEIRSYNNDNEYDDFELDCVSDNNGSCISNFLHNIGNESTAKVTLQGTCANATTADLFTTCAN